MVGRGRAAGEQEFDQRHPDRDAKRLGRHAAPDVLHGDEPGDEFLAEPIGMGARQRLVEMMMRVNEPGQHDMARGVERRIPGGGGRLATPDAFDDFRFLDDHAALRSRREYGDRVLDPQAHETTGSVSNKGLRESARAARKSQARVRYETRGER